MSDHNGGFPAGAFRRLAELEPGNYWFESRNRLILWVLGRFFPAAHSMLEIGCGTGFVLQAIRAARPDMALTASDFFDEGLQIARTRVPDATFMQLDATELDGSRRFDVLGAFDVLEHIADDAMALRGLQAATAPGGGLIVTVPQHPWLWSHVDAIGHHVRRYTRRELIGKVRAAGFEPVLVTSFVSVLLPVIAVSRWRTNRRHEVDESEFAVPSWLNTSLRWLLDLERITIRLGCRWPAGGSLLLVAQRADED